MTKEQIIAKYIARYGKAKAPAILDFLGREKPFIDAISTEVGAELMAGLISKADKSFNKLRSLLSDVVDIDKLNVKTIIAQAEYNVCLEIIRDTQGRINKYNQYSNLE